MHTSTIPLQVTALQAKPTHPGKSLTINAPGGTIACRVDGNPDGPTLLFSNSHATNYGMWEAQVALFAERYHVVRYDQRGHGATPVKAGICTFDTLALDIEHILDALSLDVVTLLGVSMGAVTVMRCAALLGERIERVVCCDGQWASPPGAQALWQQRIDTVWAEGTRALADETLQRWFTKESIANNAQSVTAAREMIESTSAEGYAQCAAAMQEYDFKVDYPTLELPVLYVVGERDGKIPIVMREMAKATPHSKLIEIEKCAHLPNMEQAQAFNNVIQQFLNDTEVA